MPKTAPKLTRNRESQVAPKGKTTAQLVRAANRWRDQYNPLRSLVISRVVQLLEAGERGEFADLQWLYRFVEKRFPVHRAVLKRRRAALDKLDWDIKVVSELPAGATETMAEEQRQFLRGRYELIENLRDAIRHLALAEFRGFSVLQKHRFDDGPNDGAVRELHWLPQWLWVRDGQFGDWYWNEKAQSGANALSLGDTNRVWPDDQAPEGALKLGDFIIRVEDMPINEIATIAFVNCSMGKKDWAAFVEIFGLPGCIIEMPPGIPAGKEDEYRDSAEDVAEGASGAVPNGSKPYFPSSSVRGNAPFKEFLDAEKEDVVLAGTGGKLTMLNEATGIGGGQGEVHDDAFDDLAESEAGEISEIFQRQFDKLELSQEFPGQPVLAYFQLEAQAQEDATAIVDRAVKLDGIGFRPDAAEISEKISLTLVDEGRPAPASQFGAPPSGGLDDEKAPGRAGGTAIRNREAGPQLSQSQQLAAAVVADLAPITQRLGRILDIQDAALQRKKLEQFLAELPQLLRDINADPGAARVLQGAMAHAMAEGLAGDSDVRNRILNYNQGQPRDGLGKWVDANGGGLSIRDNIARGRNALNRAVRQQADVPKAMHRKEVGQIDFPWGRPGTPKPDARGVTHADGYGVAKMLAKHPRELRDLPVTLAKGRIIPHDREPETKRYVIHKNNIAVLGITPSKSWTVTHLEDPKKIRELETKSRPPEMAGK